MVLKIFIFFSLYQNVFRLFRKFHIRMLVLDRFFQRFHMAGKTTDLRFKRIFHSRMIQFVRMIHGLTLHTDYFSGNTYHCRSGRYIVKYHGIGTDSGIIAYIHGPQDLRAGSDQDIVSQCRMTLSFTMAGTTERHTMVNRTVVADLRSLTDDDPHTVVDE